MNRLIAYGCSWTSGEGCDSDIESTLTNDKLLKFRNKNSWPYFLSKKLNIHEYINNGISGNSNIKIFNQIINEIETKKINSNDFICIMFSSSLRDNVPFLPEGEWVSNSVKHLIQTPDNFYNSYNQVGSSLKFNKFLSNYKKFFLTNLFTSDYYNIVNQNYIIFLQKILDEYGIRYIMMESFESMIHYPLNNDYINLINFKTIYGNLKTTFRDVLNTYDNKDIWERPHEYDILATQHPNKFGYEIISNTLFEFIKKNNIL